MADNAQEEKIMALSNGSVVEMSGEEPGEHEQVVL